MNTSPDRRPQLIMLAILFFWAALALLGPLLAPYSFDDSENLIITRTDEGRTLHYSPHPPSKRHLLGTDVYGYDLLTSMLYGARYTIGVTLITALLRTVLGFLIGYHRSRRRALPGRQFSLFIGLPSFIIIYVLVFGFIFNPDAPPLVVAAIQTILFVIFGLSAAIGVFREKISLLSTSPFIEAAASCGGSRYWILKRHYLPHLAEDISILFSQEIISTLTLIGQLGIFSVFIGGTQLTTGPLELISITREWGGLIGQGMGKIASPYWWITIFPLSAYLLLFASVYAGTQVLERHARKTFVKASNL
jgi:peptide/nickel transport system permease protein